jgi:NAD(P) transhydrogenase
MIRANDFYDVIVIGSGPAGQNAAVEAASRGATTLIIEQERFVGGACLQYGTIPSKTLRETALTLSAFQRRSGDVYQISHAAELSICSLTTRLDQVVHAHQETTRRCLEMAGVERASGRGSFQSEHEILIENVLRERRTVTGSTIVVATGSRPRSPAHIAVDHENILDSDSILSMTYLPSSIVVLGSGVIACEYASTFAALGVKVTMVDKWPTPLGFLDPELIEVYLAGFRASGGIFRGCSEVASVRWDGVSAVRVTLTDGEVLLADKAFAALGRVANLESLQIGRAGLKASDRGLLDVNQFCQTSVPHIYAVGDAIGPPALASASMEQGRRAVSHALAGAEHAGLGMIPTGIYTIPEIATVGLDERQAVQKHGGAMVGRVSYDQLARAHIMASTTGMLKLVADSQGEKLLGVQIAGDGATDLIHLGQMAIAGQMSVSTFATSIFNFPTMAEAYRLATLDIIHQRTQQQNQSLKRRCVQTAEIPV